MLTHVGARRLADGLAAGIEHSFERKGKISILHVTIDTVNDHQARRTDFSSTIMILPRRKLFKNDKARSMSSTKKLLILFITLSIWLVKRQWWWRALDCCSTYTLVKPIFGKTLAPYGVKLYACFGGAPSTLARFAVAIRYLIAPTCPGFLCADYIFRVYWIICSI